MELIFIILILLLGIVFVLLEIIVFPGVTVSGIAGIALLTLGIYFAYSDHGNVVGHLTLSGTIVIAIVATALAFRYSAWRKVSLETKIDGQVNLLKDLAIEVGDEGKTLTRLAPVGSIKIQDRIIEAKSRQGYINEGVSVEIVKVMKNAVVVIPKSK
ncbi:NfeD-like partner-binding protein [Balneicella halophila]|uniref:NfeD-like partner-binding protein n=1 Tax=Balneicella halophila TaxID=1537566 RepID=A0A7L4UQ13_BALHA|nr:NfeD family protein [Balneicella halophila]PVX51868.1 NfeD-like partner-binding protein [Balneicella halophila]